MPASWTSCLSLPRASRGGEGLSSPSCAGEVLLGPSCFPHSWSPFRSPTSKYTHLRPNQETKRKNEELGNRPYPPGMLLLASVVKTDYDREESRERGWAIWDSHPGSFYLQPWALWAGGYTGTGAAVLSMLLWVLCQKWAVQFSHPVVSDSLRPHGLQHARVPCPLPTVQNRQSLWKPHSSSNSSPDIPRSEGALVPMESRMADSPRVSVSFA